MELAGLCVRLDVGVDMDAFGRALTINVLWDWEFSGVPMSWT